MTPVRLSCALAAVALLLTACTGSSGSASGSSRTAGAATSPVGGGPTPAGSEPGSNASGRRTAGVPTGSGTPTALRTTVRQGLHATYTVRVWVQESSTACGAQAHGTKVLAYLRTHPCRRLVRYLATTTTDGKTVGISGSMITFAGATAAGSRSAAGFAALLTDSADGGIDDLFGDGKRLPGGPSSLPATRARNARNDAATVATVDAWYLSGRTRENDPGLTELLEAIT